MTTPDATGRARAIVFDLGGVLLDWNPRYLYRKLFDGDDAAMERFLSEVCTLEWHHAHDLGVPPERTCAELARAHPEQSELIWAWSRRSEEMISGPIDGTVELLAELRDAGVPCYALTNMERETYPLRRERFPFLGWFDGTVVSGFEGVAKPDPAIFELLLDRFELEPSETMMVDDSPANVRAARSAGIQAIEFQSPDRLRRRLEDAGLLDGPPARETDCGSDGPDFVIDGSDGVWTGRAHQGAASVFLFPVLRARILAGEQVDEVLPAARLTPGSRSRQAGAPPCGGSSAAVAAASMRRSTPRSCRDATSSAGTKRGPSPTRITSPWKMSSSGAATTWSTVPTCSPPDAYTGTPRSSTS